MDITATITDAVWTKGHKGLHVCGIDSRDDGQTITSPIVAIDRDRQLARTESGSVYHVPGPWPDDLDIPYMRAPVREYVRTDSQDWKPHLAAYLTTEVGGTWNALVECTDLMPGVYLRAWLRDLDVYVDVPAGMVRLSHPTARTPKAIAEALRDLPALRAWLLAELDAARAVVGGAK